MLTDVNVLVAAYRVDHPHHKTAAAWVKENVGENGQSMRNVIVTVGILSGFVRLVTNRRIFPSPASSAEAMDFIDWLLEHDTVQLMESSSEWLSFRSLILDKGLTGNEVPDAQLAALCLSLSIPFVTFDKGFRTLLPRSLLRLLPAH